MILKTNDVTNNVNGNTESLTIDCFTFQQGVGHLQVRQHIHDLYPEGLLDKRGDQEEDLAGHFLRLTFFFRYLRCSIYL